MTILEQIAASEQIGTLASAAEREGSAAALFGAHKVHRAVAAAAFSRLTGRKALLVCESDSDAFKAADDMNAMGFSAAAALPSRELTLLDVEGMSRDEETERLSVFARAAAGKLDVVCCSVEALCLRTIPRSDYLSRGIRLKKGSSADMRQTAAALVGSGYSRCDRVEGKGQYALRGDILDVFPVDRDAPCRVEFFGDEVDRISAFDPDTQRRGKEIPDVKIPPAREITFGDEARKAISGLRDSLPDGPLRKTVERDLAELEQGISPVCSDRYLNACYGRPETIADYMEGAVLFLCDWAELENRYKSLCQRHAFDLEALADKGMYHRKVGGFYADLDQLVSGRNRVYCELFSRSLGDVRLDALVNLKGNAVPRWNGDMEMLKEDLQGYLTGGYHCAVMAGTEKAAKAVRDDLAAAGIEAVLSGDSFGAAGTVSVLSGTLSTGFEISPLRMAVMSYGTGRSQAKAPVRSRKKAASAFGSLEDLKPGDYVVHQSHGIGVYEGIKRIDHHGFIADYIRIAYRGGDTLYVPVTGLDMVSPYVTATDSDKVKLDKLNSGDWQKTKQNVYRSVREMAKELIQLYAKREHTEGISFSGDTEWQRDFEARFPYDETEDQLRSAEEIRRDMESRKPMDRLLCGDVGVGKTEVALRAAFRCVTDGYQVAFLVPTTILALQHYQTILERMEGYPVNTAMLSRFTTPKEMKKAVEGIRSGKVDIAVGTHRLLQKDIEFKKLGLLIVDEEQRFGVAHKEKLKEKFPGVDVLTLSATPIPRTLNMAMNGIRDMSTIESYPVDRHPIQTYVTEYDQDLVKNAVKRELSRGGQVYYLHNRVESIEETAASLRKMLPEARIEVAHGQMGEDQLSEVWRRMVSGDCDILVCTTIIETGVDVPNCNTLIVEDADSLGLAQLYQIRGRVGRSSRRAYAWLLYRKDKILTEISANRLSAIRDFTSFGSGFRIAMRDLQIRGAGSVLSARQSGHIKNVGYDTYIRILEQAVRDEQGLPAPKQPAECKIDMQVSAYLPNEYIPDSESRIEMYKRIADITGKADYDDVTAELEDRFGKMPECVRLLCEVSSCRAGAAKLGFTEIRDKGGSVLLYNEDLTPDQVKAAVKSIPGRVYYTARGRKYVAIERVGGEEPLDAIFKVIDAVRETAPAG